MEKYFEDPDTLTERNSGCIKRSTIGGKVVPMMCGSAFKNKGVQAMLDMVMEILPSPLDTQAIVGTLPNPDEEASNSRVQRNHSQLWLLKSLPIHL